MAIWVAVGGRGTLAGALLGAWLVNGAKSWLTAAFPSAWLYALGALFVLVTLFLPKGIVGVTGPLSEWLARRRAAAQKPVAAQPLKQEGT
jgi:urea transport system permease protein